MAEQDFDRVITGGSDADNRRSKTRIPFMGLRLKVRKRGQPRSTKFQECYSVDLSNSGLAFTSNSLKLTELEKVDFILSFQNQSIQGTALVRYIQQSAEVTQYGLMFLQVLPELDSVLGAENLTTEEIKHLAGSLAEHVGYSIQENRNEQLRLTRQRQRFCDALHAFFERLSEMGVRLLDVHTPGRVWVSSRNAIEIDEVSGHVDFFRYSTEDDEFVPERVQLKQHPENNHFSYVTGSGETFRNLFELLAYISDEIALVAKLAYLDPQQETKAKLNS